MISFKKANDIPHLIGRAGCDPASRRTRCRTAIDDSETIAETTALVLLSQTFDQSMPAKLERPAPQRATAVDERFANSDVSAAPQFPDPVNQTSILAATSLSSMRKEREPVLEALWQESPLNMEQACWQDAILRLPQVTARAPIGPAVRELGSRQATPPSMGAETKAEPTLDRSAGIQPDLPITGLSSKASHVREMWRPGPDGMKRQDRQSKLAVKIDRTMAADSALAGVPHADNRALALPQLQLVGRPTGKRDPSFLFPVPHVEDDPKRPSISMSSRPQDSGLKLTPDQPDFLALVSRLPQADGHATSVESLPAGTAAIMSANPAGVIIERPRERPLEEPGTTSDRLEPPSDPPDGLTMPDFSSVSGLTPMSLPTSPARQIVSALGQVAFPVPPRPLALNVKEPHQALTHTINLELYPADLGRVVVTMRFKDKKVSLHISTATSGAATAIDHDRSTLHELALRAGLDSVEATITVASRPLPSQPQPFPDQHDVAIFRGPGEYGWRSAGGEHAGQGNGHQQSSEMMGGTHGEEEQSPLVSPGRGPDVHRRGIFL